jgi:nucleotide-binding universal stress UspA family protein
MCAPINVRRVVVGVSGSLANLAALHAAADLARRCDVPLLAVHANDDPDAGAATVRHAVERAFGATPPGVDVRMITVCATAGPALVSAAIDAEAIVVLGAGRRRRTPVARYCATHARCPVLTVAPPPMAGLVSRRELRASRVS